MFILLTLHHGKPVGRTSIAHGITIKGIGINFRDDEDNFTQ